MEETLALLECDRCGAIVLDQERHTDWHRKNEAEFPIGYTVIDLTLHERVVNIELVRADS